MKGDLYVILNSEDHILGAFSAEKGTGGERVALVLSLVPKITIKLLHQHELHIHSTEAVKMTTHPLAGRTMRVIAGQFKGETFHVEDLASNILGPNAHRSLHFAIDAISAQAKTPLYGHIGEFGYVVAAEDLGDD